MGRWVRSVAVAFAVGGLLGWPTSAPGSAAASPAEVGSSDWRVVSAGGNHTCGIRTSGRLFCWGDDGTGQLGDGGANTDQDTPVEVAGGATDWTHLSAGGHHTCARRST